MTPSNHEDAKSKNRHGRELLDRVQDEKRRAALSDPGADRSRANAERARREGWRSTRGPRT